MLKLRKVVRDEDGKIVSVSPLRKLAVLVNEETEETVVRPVEDIELTAMLINWRDGIAQFEFRVGARGADGTFYRDSDFQTALWSVNRESERDRPIWERFKNVRQFSIDGILQWLHEHRAILRACQNVWKITGVETFIE